MSDWKEKAEEAVKKRLSESALFRNFWKTVAFKAIVEDVTQALSLGYQQGQEDMKRRAVEAVKRASQYFTTPGALNAAITSVSALSPDEREAGESSLIESSNRPEGQK